MKKLFLIPLMIIVVSALIFGGCARPAPAPAPPAPPIKIGVMYPLTGPVAITGERMVNACKLAFAEAGYEVAGRKIELIVEDSGGLGEVSLDKARKLVEHDKVCMLLGPLFSHVRLAIAPYMSKMRVPHITTAPAKWEVHEYEWTIPVGGSESACPWSIARYAYDEMGLRTVTFMSMDMGDGRALGAYFKAAFTERGGQVIQEQYPPFPCPDYAPYLVALKDADALVAWFHGADAMRFLTQVHEYGIRQRMPLAGVFHGSFFAPYILHGLPPEAAEAMIGECCPTPYSRLLEPDVNKRFVEALKKRYGEEYVATMDETDSGPYQGALVALEALKATGGDTTAEKLHQAIMVLDFEGPQGRVRFDPETRFAIKSIYIIKVDKIGEEYVQVPVYTYKDVLVPLRGS